MLAIMFVEKSPNEIKIKMNNTNFYKLSLDVYPSLESDLADKYSCAIIDAYVSPTNNLNLQKTIENVTDIVFDEGWIVASVICSEEVSEADVMGRSREIYQNGYSFSVNRIKTEWIWLWEQTASTKVSNEIRKFLDISNQKGEIFTLYSEKHKQYANGVTHNGDEFIPFWISGELARNWMPHYDSYEPCRFSVLKYTEWMFPKLIQNQMLIAVGTGDDFVITAHPKIICNQISIMHS
jgi:uncharacterized protein DUF2750